MVVKRNEKQPSSKRQQPSPQSAAQQPVLLSPPPPPPQQPAKLSSQFTPPMSHEDELLFPGSFMDERERSHTPPLFSSYSTYPPPDEMMMPPYGSAQPSYGRTPVTDAYPDYLTTAATVPVTLPPLTHFSDAMNKRDTAYGGDDASLHGYMSYGFLDMNAGAYDHSNPHVSSCRQSSHTASTLFPYHHHQSQQKSHG